MRTYFGTEQTKGYFIMIKNVIDIITGPFSLIYRYRNILYQTTRSDIRMRFAGSVLGPLWLFLYPLLFLSAYAIIYLFIFHVKIPVFTGYEYVAFIFCGLIPFIGFADTLGLGVTCVVSNTNLIKNTLFPIELVPVKAVLVSQCTQTVGMAMLFIALAWMGRLTIYFPLIFFIWALQIIFSIGVIWLLSSINIFVRDLNNLIAVLILILMMISPIAYTVDMIPPSLLPLIGLNPLYYLIVSYQDILMLGQWPPSNIFGIFLILTITIFYSGYWIFMKLKGVFVDNV
jgi:lipopolysaccharide transport system permease protein